MGISIEEFWKLNPRKLSILVNGYKLHRKLEDEHNWLLGGYVYSGVSAALGNAFGKKNHKSKSYFEIINKPFLSEIENNNNGEMSEEEKQKRLDALMASLHVMKNNFEINHGK